MRLGIRDPETGEMRELTKPDGPLWCRQAIHAEIDTSRAEIAAEVAENSKKLASELAEMLAEHNAKCTASLADELLKNIEGFRPIREVTVEEAITVAGVRIHCALTPIQFLRPVFRTMAKDHDGEWKAPERLGIVPEPQQPDDDCPA